MHRLKHYATTMQLKAGTDTNVKPTPNSHPTRFLPPQFSILRSYPWHVQILQNGYPKA